MDWRLTEAEPRWIDAAPGYDPMVAAVVGVERGAERREITVEFFDTEPLLTPVDVVRDALRNHRSHHPLPRRIIVDRGGDHVTLIEFFLD